MSNLPRGRNCHITHCQLVNCHWAGQEAAFTPVFTWEPLPPKKSASEWLCPLRDVTKILSAGFIPLLFLQMVPHDEDKISFYTGDHLLLIPHLLCSFGVSAAEVVTVL